MTRYESIRESAVSGQFYSNNPERLRETVTGYLSENKRKIPSSAIGIISPHAGYIFSGPTAGLTISSVKIPDKLIVVGPNHYGEGPPVSVMPEGLWKFPGFSVPVASELSALILDKSRAAVPDFNAHRKDHSIEVQIPFFYYSNPSISFVPISIYAAGMALVCDLADAIANSVKETDGEILLVASSDMSHRISEDKAKKLDMLASEHILSLNWEEFLKTVSSMNISICGAIPIAVVMAAALRLGATSVEMTDYTSSAAVTGDKDDVVGYAGFLIK